jgi:hypothetical protein
VSDSIHLCIATGQNLANLIPAVQLEASEVWILQTPAMRQNASHLTAALKSRKITTRAVSLDDSDVAAIGARADELALELAGRPVTVNLTGGTKLMTVALVRSLLTETSAAAASQSPSLIYTDTERGRIDRLAPGAGSERMRSVLRLDDVLLVQGYRRQPASGGAEAAEWARQAQDRADLTRELGDEAGQVGGFIGALNSAAHAALDGPGGRFQHVQRLRGRVPKQALTILELAQAQGLLVREGDSQIVFHDREAAIYLGGGWVEEYAGLKTSGARADGGWAPRMRVEHVDTKSANELDAALVHRNRMLIVECKAARPDADDRKVADWIYKISQLSRQIGGSHASALLLSARELLDEHRRRAEEYGVAVLAAGELNRLGRWLRDWMGPSGADSGKLAEP